jgi:hypothetical protein
MRLPIPAVATAVLAGVVYGLAARLAFEADSPLTAFGSMTFVFVVLVPLAVGYLSVELDGRGPRRTRRAVLIPAMTTLACLAFVLAAGLEGIICVILIAPLFLLFATLGGALSIGVRRYACAPRMHASALATVLLLPYLAAPLENRIPLPDTRRIVDARVIVHADAETVWRNLVRPTGIRREENRARLAHRIGFPRPVTATLSHEGVGGSRYAVFERGVMLRETVTEWVPGRRMAFTIDPASIPARALDEHVTVGGPFFDVIDGRYEIVPLDGGRVELRLVTTHRLSTHFNAYAAFWTDLLLRQIQENLLHIVRTRAEAGR